MVLAVEGSREHMRAVTDGLELRGRRIDILRQLVIRHKRIRDIVSDFLEFFIARNLDPVRDRHVARRAPNRIGERYIPNPVSEIERVLRRVRFRPPEPLAEQFPADIHQGGDNRTFLPLGGRRGKRNRDQGGWHVRKHAKVREGLVFVYFPDIDMPGSMIAETHILVIVACIQVDLNVFVIAEGIPTRERGEFHHLYGRQSRTARTRIEARDLDIPIGCLDLAIIPPDKTTHERIASDRIRRIARHNGTGRIAPADKAANMRLTPYAPYRIGVVDYRAIVADKAADIFDSFNRPDGKTFRDRSFVIADDTANIVVQEEIHIGIRYIHQIHHRDAPGNRPLGIARNSARVANRLARRLYGTARSRPRDNTVIVSDNAAGRPIRNNNIHIGKGRIDCSFVCFAHNSTNPYRTLDLALERDILYGRLETGIPYSPHRSTRDTADALFALHKAVRHVHVLNCTDEPRGNATYMSRFLRIPGHFQTVEIQVLDRSDKGVEKADIVFAGHPDFQVADRMVLAVDGTPERSTVGGVLLLADRDKAVAAALVTAHLVRRGRSVDIGSQHVVRRIQVGALAYRLQVFVILDLERLFGRTLTLHGAVRRERMDRKQRQNGSENKPQLHHLSLS